MEWDSQGHKGSLLSRSAGFTSVGRMSGQRILRFYLEDGLRQSAAAGQHNFINKIANVVQDAGYRVEYRHNSTAERLKSAERRGYSMFHMDAPQHARALTIRRVYHYPFWAIEPSAKRWEWRVARTEFPAQDVSRKAAERFYCFWRDRLFGTAPDHTSRKGFVYVPLQGLVLDHRSFQTCSPLDMLRAVLQHEPQRPIVATLHPKETYTPADLSALEQLQQDHPRLSLRTGEMVTMLQTCDYVVTQNSSVAFDGFFFGKPAVLFGQIDFHHIAANVADLGPAAAIRQAPRMAPDYAGYMQWFWQVMSINAGRAQAEQQIRAALLRAGWPM